MAGGCGHLLFCCRPPVPVGTDAHGRALPGEVPSLFGGDIVKYILVRDSPADSRLG